MTKIIAHRGASAYAPENTMEAFQIAIEMGADAIELDIHMSADGHIVVCHDETINRTSNGKGEIAKMTLEALRRHNYLGRFVGKQFNIPTLAEVLELIRPTQLGINIELKGGMGTEGNMEKRVLELVEEMSMGRRVLYSSFDHYCLSRIKSLLPTAKTGLLYSNRMYEPWIYAGELRASALHPKFSTVKGAAYIKNAHEVGLKVNVWTVDSPKDMKKAIAFGVDGIITNVPNIARKVLEESELS